VYGPLAMCSPAIKLSYAMSAYFSVNPIDSSCDFGGNATLVPNRESRAAREMGDMPALTPGPNTAQDASAAASSCLAQVPSGGVFTPSPSSAGPSATQTGGSGASSAPASTSNAAGASMGGISSSWVGGSVMALAVGMGVKMIL